MSPCGKFIACGCADGTLIIYQLAFVKTVKTVSDFADVEKTLDFIDQNEVKRFTEHTADIIDIDWSHKVCF